MNGCMANACATPLVATPAAAKSPACPSKKTSAASFRARAVSCRATNGGRGGDDLLWLPRREMLTSLGGVAAGLIGYQSFSSVANAEEEKCAKGDKVTESLIECTDPTIPCPPTRKSPVVDFKPESAVKRIRKPVHLLNREYQEKYKEAVGKMKALPASNPLSFVQQAAIHEAYCDGHYQYDPENKNVPFDVHFSWIFAPWHRMYIYFYEKALGDLIGDDTFALPFWNWDTPAGMVVPALFKDSFANPLYDRNRNPDNLDKIVHLDMQDKHTPVNFNGPKDKEYQACIYHNLATMHQQQIRGARSARAFLGEPLCTKGEKQGTSSQGSLERMAHTALHVWVGRKNAQSCAGGVIGHNNTTYCSNDMGFLGSAGRDPLFYSHHCNVDRLWHIWATKLGGEGFKDPEYLDATFVFYDDVKNPKPVRIKFRDVIDTTNLGYTYDAESDKDLPWKECALTSLVPHAKGGLKKLKSAAKAAVFPVTLKKGEVVEIPAVAVPAKRVDQQRVLVIKGIEFDPSAETKFDVAINVPKGSALDVTPTNVEFAGSFAVVPSSTADGGKVMGGATFTIEDCLNDIKAADDSTVDICIVPRSEGEIKITSAPTIQV